MFGRIVKYFVKEIKFYFVKLSLISFEGEKMLMKFKEREKICLMVDSGMVFIDNWDFSK